MVSAGKRLDSLRGCACPTRSVDEVVRRRRWLQYLT
jgi:hypothetical protein